MVSSDYINDTPRWESLVALAGLSRDSMELNPSFVEPLEPSLWIELATEYDAEHFCEYLKGREVTGELILGSMFSRFESLWRRDELNHVRGFARIYSMLYSISEEDLFAKLRSRQPSFNTIEPFLVDEFAICVVLAYDEIATTKSYQQDMLHRYPKFKNSTLINWIKLVARDEARHFENVLNIIKKNHSHRISEVPTFLDRLMNFDASGEEYGATFVLDHSANNYDSAALDSCRSLILSRLGLTKK